MELPLLTNEQLSLLNLALGVINLLVSGVVGILIIFIKFTTDKLFQKYILELTDKKELRTKLLDRLVEIEDFINRKEEIDKEVCKRIRMCTNRTDNYDKDIKKEFNNLLNYWNKVDQKFLDYDDYKKSITTEETTIALGIVEKARKLILKKLK